MPPLRNWHQLPLPFLLQTYTPAPQRPTRKGGRLLGQLEEGDKELDGARAVPSGQSTPSRLGPTLAMGIQAGQDGEKTPFSPAHSHRSLSTPTEACLLGCLTELGRDRGGEAPGERTGKGVRGGP